MELINQMTIISLYSDMSTDLDPIHSKLSRECPDSILTSLTDPSSFSTASCIISQCFTSPLVTSTVKKEMSLFHNDLNDY